MSKIGNILKIFKEQFIIFLDELIAQFPKETDLIIARIFIKDQLPIETVMVFIINKILPFKEKVKNRDESFFLKKDDLFEGLSPSKSLHFKRLWISKNLDKDDREAIWNWFESFIYLAEKYQDSL